MTPTPPLPKPQRRASRDPEDVRELFAGLATRKDVLEAAEAILTNPAHQQWARVWSEVLDRGYGRPTQPITTPADQPFVVFAAMPQPATSTEAWQQQAKRTLK